MCILVSSNTKKTKTKKSLLIPSLKGNIYLETKKILVLVMMGHVKTPLWLVGLVIFLVALKGLVKEVDGAGECGRTPLNTAAASLTPCLGAARNGRAKVPPVCCTKVNALIRTAPRCLCAVLLSPLAKKAGIMPATAISIPKRCSIRNRPAGKKCGRYTVP